MNPKAMRDALAEMETKLDRFARDAEKEIYQGKPDDRVDTAWRARAQERLAQAHRAVQTAITGLEVAYEIHDAAEPTNKEESHE